MTLKQKAYDAIRGWIVSGRLPEGSVTSEHALTEQLDMSRTPLRAALQLLESEGFLRIVPKHGILILHASAQRMSDLLELLMSLIIFAFEQNKRTKAAEITAIVDRFYDTHASAEAATPEQWAAAERDLWQQLVALGQNREMMHFFEVTLGKCRWDINVRRWKTAYRTETEACLRQLLASMVKKNDREGPDFFAYLFIWKKTWL